uniref:Valine--tRNA ligase, mitochondrial n=1 Tax=Corethron hystrix TaxID=216773 RepID=A0A7S1FW38_9STRA|mmetsp:Transcript_33173/g.76523  ORF Transcript_33173/g.76523 Transcript_33173/m.76523 type:complete len:1115 (+) Transcript_33173:78-3422(+)
MTDKKPQTECESWVNDEKFAALAAYTGASLPPPDVPTPVAAAPAPDPAAPPGEKKLSKKELKRLAKGKGKKEKKEKPASWGAPGAKKKKEKSPASASDAAALATYMSSLPPPGSGGKKDMAALPMLPAYHPAAVESRWNEYWERSGFYSCDPATAAARSEAEKFTMVIPPPNVTGSLHLGHALTCAVEDTLARWHRMSGRATMYVPGTDHAGIATQSVVEKMLAKTEGKNRHDLGRKAFVEKVWEWKKEYGGKITNQLRFLGSSVDWSRERFTMDDTCGAAVTEAFVRFHESGLLYRDTRLGNWSCALKSAISDIEVESLELEGRTFLNVPNHPGNPKDELGRYEFGTITSFSYPVIDGREGEVLTVATTRLETMLGDTAVAVHPDDPRYKHLHGKFLQHPFFQRKIPIITDGTLVDMNFGTGAVKVTPAHDPNDYECGKRNNLEFITVIDEGGAMCKVIAGEECTEFGGMMRYDARIAVEKALDAKGLYGGKKPNKMRLATCSRSGDILEPMITPQWYVNCNSMAKRAADAVRDGDLKILPAEHEKTWFQWLDNIRDWCVSRQLWWGHRIPAWFATQKGEKGVSKNDMEYSSRWIVARDEDAARVKAAALLKCPEGEVDLSRDEDVLDTWFSSGLFPFSVFGWPNQTDDMKAFYPTTLLETGSDILFFWVARMVMMGLQLTDVLPFKTVYLHAMVRDKDGRKMSKSLGNVIDPLEVINGCTLATLNSKLDNGNLPAKEVVRAKADQASDFPDGIPECGSDALRFGLLAYTVQGRDVNLDIKRVVGYRQFCNKLWNATRFALQFVTDFEPTASLLHDLMSQGNLAVRDKYMISRLMNGCGAVVDHFTNYKFGDAQMASYQLWMDNICDVYLELIKPVVYDKTEDNAARRRAAQGTLWVALETGLRLLHPMMPYVTEELWQRLPGRGTLGAEEPESIMLAPYPERVEKYRDPQAEASMEVTMGIVRACRSLRSSYQINHKDLAKFYVKVAPGSDAEKYIVAQTDDIQTLGRASSVSVNVEVPDSVGIVIVDDQCTLYMDLAGLVDFQAELAKLQKNLGKTLPSVKNLATKMQAAGYEEKVKAEIKAQNVEKLEALKKKVADLETAIETFKRLATK